MGKACGRAQTPPLRCRLFPDFPDLVEQPLTRPTDDADSWLRDGLGQTPLLTSGLRFTDRQRPAVHGLRTCAEEHTPCKCTADPAVNEQVRKLVFKMSLIQFNNLKTIPTPFWVANE